MVGKRDTEQEGKVRGTSLRGRGNGNKLAGGLWAQAMPNEIFRLWSEAMPNEISRRPCLQNRSQLNMRLKMASNLPVFMNIFSAKQMLVLRRKSWGSNRWQYIMLSHFSKR